MAKKYTAADIDAHLHDMFQILTDCQISLMNMTRLSKDEHPSERLLLRTDFAEHLRAQYWFTQITQLDKLHSDSTSQLRSFAEFGRQIEIGFADDVRERMADHKGDWKSVADIAHTMEAIVDRATKLKDQRDILMLLRHNVTAHTAPKWRIENSQGIDLPKLTEAAERSLDLLYKGWHGTGVGFGTKLIWSIEPFIKGFSQDHQRTMEELEQHARQVGLDLNR